MYFIYLFVCLSKCCSIPTICQSVGSHINPKDGALLSHCGTEISKNGFRALFFLLLD